MRSRSRHRSQRCSKKKVDLTKKGGDVTEYMMQIGRWVCLKIENRAIMNGYAYEENGDKDIRNRTKNIVLMNFTSNAALARLQTNLIHWALAFPALEDESKVALSPLVLLCSVMMSSAKGLIGNLQQEKSKLSKKQRLQWFEHVWALSSWNFTIQGAWWPYVDCRSHHPPRFIPQQERKRERASAHERSLVNVKHSPKFDPLKPQLG